MKAFIIFLISCAALALALQSLARGPGDDARKTDDRGGHDGAGDRGGHTPSFSGGSLARGNPGHGNSGHGNPHAATSGGGPRASFVPQNRSSFAQRQPNFNGAKNFANIDRPNTSANRGAVVPNNRATVANRPTLSFGNRNDSGIGDRPGIVQGNRPEWRANRSEFGDRQTFDRREDNFDRSRAWPNAGDRLGDRNTWGDNRDWSNRPNHTVANRPAIGTRYDWSNNANTNRNWNTNVNRNWNTNINRWAGVGGRSWTRPWYDYYDRWHRDWHHGYWNYWGGGLYPWAWLSAGTVAGWWASPGVTYVYDNPYYVAPDSTVIYYPDYSQPIPAPLADTALGDTVYDSAPVPGDFAAATANIDDPNAQQAVAIFDVGRTLFQDGDYQRALDKADQAIQILPSDTNLHEFRALCLFALGRYKEAAAGIYAVLSAGPGWDWDTLKSFYPDTAVYTVQLRRLEDFKKTHPTAPEASFLLAYHYLVMGYPDQAANELQQVLVLQPDDKLAAAVLDALQKRSQPAVQLAPQPQEM